MNRLTAAFDRARAENRAAFVSYICAGDPDFEHSLEVCRALIDGGVDVLELGVPFSDPLADGLTNQLAAQRALEAGMTPGRVFDLVKEIRKFSEAPVVLYTYYNLIFAQGEEAYAGAAKAAGVDGLLTLDLPPEEADGLLAACRGQKLANIFLIAPTTPDSRLPKILQAATGFLYYVSREGVTGVRDQVATDIPEAVARIRKHTGLPIAVGFGISRPDQVSEVARVADGVVVGSALVNVIKENVDAPERIGPGVREMVEKLRSGLVRAVPVSRV